MSALDGLKIARLMFLLNGIMDFCTKKRWLE